MEIKAKYDQIVGWRHGQGNPGDKDYIPQGPDMRCYHFTFGKPGGDITGGFYIKIDGGIPDEIILKIPPIDGQFEQEKWREKHESKGRGSDDTISDGVRQLNSGSLRDDGAKTKEGKA